MRVLTGHPPSLDDALDYICPSPWDTVTFGKYINRTLKQPKHGKYKAGMSVQVEVISISQDYVLLLALVNPSLISMIFLRSKTWFALGFVVACMFIACTMYISQHAKDMISKRKWLTYMSFHWGGDGPQSPPLSITQNASSGSSSSGRLL